MTWAIWIYLPILYCPLTTDGASCYNCLQRRPEPTHVTLSVQCTPDMLWSAISWNWIYHGRLLVDGRSLCSQQYMYLLMAALCVVSTTCTYWWLLSLYPALYVLTDGCSLYSQHYMYLLMAVLCSQHYMYLLMAAHFVASTTCTYWWLLTL